MIKTSKETISDAIQNIKLYQSGVLKPVKTSYEHFNINCLGGIYPGMIIVIAGISEMGKTHFVSQIENDFLNEELNLDAKDYVLLKCNWEMLAKDLFTNRIKTELKVKLSDILFSQNFNKEINEIKNKEIKDNIYYHEEAVSANQWLEEMDQFLSQNLDKKHILITLDHLALVSGDDQLKRAIDKLLANANNLKKKYKNVSFIFVSQLNREIEYRNDIRFLAPIRSDLYASDAIYHIADIIMVKHIPYNLGHEKYMYVRTKDYPHLYNWMLNPKNAHTSFFTDNGIFYHYLKIRRQEKGLSRIYIDKLDTKKEIKKPIKETENIPLFN